MRYDATLCLSGGFDSVVLAYRLVNEGKAIKCLHFDLGKLSSRQELAAAKRAANYLGTPLEVVEVHGLFQMMMGYMPVEDALADEADSTHSPKDVSILPWLLGIGVYYSQLISAPQMYVGTLKNQTKGRLNVHKSYEALSKVTTLYDGAYPEVTIQAPFIDQDKSEVVVLGNSLQVLPEMSWSCHMDGLQHCGVCSACRSRKKAFEDAKIKDTTHYAHGH